MEMKRAVETRDGRKMVFLEQVKNRDRPFVLDIAAAADHRMLVESDVCDPLLALGVAHGRRFMPRAGAGLTATARGLRALLPLRGGLPPVPAPPGLRRRSGRASCA